VFAYNLKQFSVLFRDVGTSVVQGGSKNVEANGNLWKTKNFLPIMLGTVQQQCWPQK